MEKDNKKERKLSFKCCVPARITDCSDDELRLGLVTLKNALANITVCMSRLERELKKRGASASLLESVRSAPSPEIIEFLAVQE
jgi:hypothetical protein